MLRLRPRTTVETSVVVGLVGLLAAASAPALLRARNEAVARCLAMQLRYLQGQIDLYMARHGNAPPITAAGWTPLVQDGSLRDLPTNPAWSWIDPGPNTVEVVGTPGVRGSPEAAWVWNSVDRVIAASCFDERQSRITAVPAD
jgi:type II secretory pathway pseudopilin PulG